MPGRRCDRTRSGTPPATRRCSRTHRHATGVSSASPRSSNSSANDPPRLMIALHDLGVREAAARIRRREVSSAELVRAALARVEAVEPRVGAFLTVCEAEALAAADAIDRRIAAGDETGPLGGVPIGVKDIICTAGVRTTAASRILGNFVPAYDATVVARLRRAGAVILGKLNC